MTAKAVMRNSSSLKAEELTILPLTLATLDIYYPLKSRLDRLTG